MSDSPSIADVAGQPPNVRFVTTTEVSSWFDGLNPEGPRVREYEIFDRDAPADWFAFDCGMSVTGSR
jgi:hypothetical protein